MPNLAQGRATGEHSEREIKANVANTPFGRRLQFANRFESLSDTMNVRVLAQHLTLWTHEFTFQKTEVHKKAPLKWARSVREALRRQSLHQRRRENWTQGQCFYHLMVTHGPLKSILSMSCNSEDNPRFFLCVTNFRFPTPDQLLKIIGIKQPFHCKQYRLMTRLHHTVLSTMIRI